MQLTLSLFALSLSESSLLLTTCLWLYARKSLIDFRTERFCCVYYSLVEHQCSGVVLRGNHHYYLLANFPNENFYILFEANIVILPTLDGA